MLRSSRRSRQSKQPNHIVVRTLRRLPITHQKSVLQTLHEISLDNSKNPSFNEPIIRAFRLILKAGELFDMMSHPLKDGNIILKLLDQVYFQLSQFKSKTVQFDQRQVLSGTFSPYDEQDVDGDLSDREPVQFHDILILDVDAVMENIKKAKQMVIIQQICFFIDRIRMSSFVGEVKPVKRLTFRHDRKSTLQENPPLLEPIQCRVERISVLNSQPVPSGQLTSRKKSNIEVNQQIMYNTLRDRIFQSQPMMKCDLEYRMFKNGHYNLLWDSSNKQYYGVLSSDNMLNSLNQEVKAILDDKQDCSLGSSIRQNMSTVAISIAVIVATLIILIISTSPIFIGLFTALSSVLFLYMMLQTTRQPIYSRQCFKLEIKEILCRKFQREESEYILEVQEDCLDISLIKKS